MRVAHAVINKTLLDVHEKGFHFQWKVSVIKGVPIWSEVGYKRARVWTSGQSMPV